MLLSTALGIKFADRAWAILGHGAAILTGLAAVSFVAYVMTRPGGRNRGTVGFLLSLSVFFFVVGFGLRWSAQLFPLSETLGLAAARLTVVPILLVFAALSLVLDSPDARVMPAMWRSVTIVIIGGSLLVSGVDYFSIDNRRDHGPDWLLEVEAARSRCTTSISSTAVIPTTPPGWTVELPCQRLAAPSGHLAP